ncbi:CLUMA_CG010070, isoform A [Clunio marinus]|uniref:CLUMA_CG010070, isoform A n=1 Tax=Clunio marinus TaxID=568069 RepID=A0A1J1I8V2_9DIPT|nr:CLUMA_CG010070, isoform A [Clunio marinus]
MIKSICLGSPTYIRQNVQSNQEYLIWLFEASLAFDILNLSDNLSLIKCHNKQLQLMDLVNQIRMECKLHSKEIHSKIIIYLVILQSH